MLPINYETPQSFGSSPISFQYEDFLNAQIHNSNTLQLIEYLQKQRR
jgi:hypothetical protein